MKFEEWFDEQEGARTRRDRFIDDFLFRHPFLGVGKDWLHAAYNAGFKEGSKQPVPLTVTTVPTPPYVKYPTVANPRPDDPFKRTHQPTWPNIKSCSKCGMNLSGVMGYVCYDLQCPTQMRITAGGGSTLSGVAHSSGSIGAVGSDRYSDNCGYTNCKDKK